MFMDNIKSLQQLNQPKTESFWECEIPLSVRVCAPVAEALNISNERVFCDLEYWKTRNRIALKKSNGICCLVE